MASFLFPLVLSLTVECKQEWRAGSKVSEMGKEKNPGLREAAFPEFSMVIFQLTALTALLASSAMTRCVPDQVLF